MPWWLTLCPYERLHWNQSILWNIWISLELRLRLFMKVMHNKFHNVIAVISIFSPAITSKVLSKIFFYKHNLQIHTIYNFNIYKYSLKERAFNNLYKIFNTLLCFYTRSSSETLQSKFLRSWSPILAIQNSGRWNLQTSMNRPIAYW